MFPGTKRVSTKELLHLKELKANEYYLYDVNLDDTRCMLRVFQLDTGEIFGISAMVQERLVLKTILTEPSFYKTKLHTINGYTGALERVYALEKKFPKIREIPITNIESYKYPCHGSVNYILTVGKKSKVTLARHEIYAVPMQLQPGF